MAEEIELPLETPKAIDQVVESPVTEEAPDELATLKAQLAERDAELASERGRREAAEGARDSQREESSQRIASEVNARFAAQEQTVDTRLSAAEQRLLQAKRDMVLAQSEGRWEDSANLAEEIADAKTEVKASAWEKGRLAAAKTQLTQQAERESNQDPKEAFLASIPGANSKAWLRGRPEVLDKMVSDPRYRKRVIGLAELAESEGHTPDTQAYLDYIGDGLKEKSEVVNPDPKTVEKPRLVASKSGNTAAAASGKSGATSSGGNRVVKIEDITRRLTPDMRHNAHVSFPNSTQEEAEKLYAEGIVKEKARDPNFLPEFRIA